MIRQLATRQLKVPEKRDTVDAILRDLQDQDQRHETGPNFDIWAKCLTALTDTCTETTIVLDALDECTASQRSDLITLFAELATRVSRAKVKIFVSTRPDGGMFKILDHKYSIIDVQKKGIKKDIETFLQARMLQHSEWLEFDPGFGKKTTDTIFEKSRDMFLLASLHIDRVLRYKYQQDIEDVLQSLPEKLTDAYEEVYKQATDGGKAKEFTNRALRWVLCSARRLTTDELLFAISQDPTNNSITAADKEVSERKILKSCQNLLSLDFSINNESSDIDNDSSDINSDSSDINGCGNSSPVWRLAHQAVAEFLETKDDCYLHRAHFEAAKVCLKFLRDDSFGASAWTLSHPEHNSDSSEDFSENSETFDYSESDSGISKDSLCPCTENRSLRITNPYWAEGKVVHQGLQNPLAEYAIYAWPTHVRAHEHSVDRPVRRIPETILHCLSQTLQEFLGEPNEGSRVFKRWYEHIVGGDRNPPKWCIFASRRVDSVHPTLDETDMTPIIFACHLGFYTTLKEWWDSPNLQYNACFHSFSRSSFILWMDGSETTMAWSLVAVVCASDEVEILKCLLSRGARVETQGEQEMPAIVAAAANHSNEVACELIQRDIDLRSGFTERYETVLWFAMFHSSWDIMKLLLKDSYRDQLEIKRTLARFPYQHFRSKRAISMLLDFGVDVNSSLKGATLLATAAYRGWEDMVERLLDEGARVDTYCENDSFSYALDAAMREPTHASIARRLVANGAHISGESAAQLLRHEGNAITWENLLQLLVPR